MPPLALLAALCRVAGDAAPAAPPFPSGAASAWIGPPRSGASLRGKGVVLDVGTFG